MSLNSETEALRTAVDRLRRAWDEVALTAHLDRPADPPLAAGDAVGDAVDDAIAAVHEISACTSEDASPRKLPQVGAILLTVRRSVADNLTAYDAWSRLLAAVHGQGPEWRSWTDSLAQGLATCAEKLEDAEDALLRCWRELSDGSLPDGRPATSGPCPTTQGKADHG